MQASLIKGIYKGSISACRQVRAGYSTIVYKHIITVDTYMIGKQWIYNASVLHNTHKNLKNLYSLYPTHTINCKVLVQNHMKQKQSKYV